MDFDVLRNASFRARLRDVSSYRYNVTRRYALCDFQVIFQSANKDRLDVIINLQCIIIMRGNIRKK